MAQVRLKNISFRANHGVTEAERAESRPFEVDVSLEVTTSRAERSDELGDTVDYQRVAELIIREGTAQTHRLLESLARDMIDALKRDLTKSETLAIELEIRKLKPPGCPGDPAYAAIKLSST